MAKGEWVDCEIPQSASTVPVSVGLLKHFVYGMWMSPSSEELQKPVHLTFGSYISGPARSMDRGREESQAMAERKPRTGFQEGETQ
jgi:hypothetical protein